ncbi:MAG TPA: hypothetical protein VMG08_13575 [Allosphingosinicella sp.]|nr:hypothetical protein [Allosphingosinicella sp.]
MPLYLFDLVNGNGLTADTEGRDLPDDAAARDEALKDIRSILSEEVLRGHLDLDGRIEVRDRARALLFTVAFADAVLIERQSA